MKTFDPLQAVQTRDGRPARVLAVNLAGPYPIAAAITDADGNERVESYTRDGKVLHATNESGDGLVNKPQEREAFHRIYAEPGKATGYNLSSIPHTSVDRARRSASVHRPIAGFLKLTSVDGKLIGAELIAA